MTSQFIIEQVRNGQTVASHVFFFKSYGGREGALSAASEMSEAVYEEGDDAFWVEV
jgi:hypothetical protein